MRDDARDERARSKVAVLTNAVELVEYSEDIYPYATFQLEESVPAGGDSRCNSAAPLQTFVYHDPRLSTADTLQLREVSADLIVPFRVAASTRLLAARPSTEGNYYITHLSLFDIYHLTLKFIRTDFSYTRVYKFVCCFHTTKDNYDAIAMQRVPLL